MSETTENARRWSGFVCPDCRFIFRVPRDHDGRGVICPSCRRMLRTPAAGETTPPLVGKGRKFVPVSLPDSLQRSREKKKEIPLVQQAEIQSQVEHKKRRRLPASEEDQPDWERNSQQRIRVGKRSKFPFAKAALVTVALLTVAGGILFVLQRKHSSTLAENDAAKNAPPLVTPASTANADEEVEKMDLPLEMKRNEIELLAEIEKLSREFLDATTIEQLLPLVRNPKDVEPKMRKFYKDGKVPPAGMSGFNVSGSVAYRSKLASVSVRTRDFEMKQLAFIRTAEGLKIDWESYVGWSEIPWAEFVSQKITKPVVVRAALRQVEYYNFKYVDEKKWQSFQLRSPDGEQVIYGYAKRDSEVDEKMKSTDKTEVRYVTVVVKFQPGDPSKNQVVIDQFLTDGWVEGVE